MRKRIAVILAALVAVPLFVLVVAAALIPSEQVAALAAERAEAMLGRDVTIEDVHLSIFPRPSVELSGVAVAGATPEAEPLAELERARLQPRILPLFRRQVVIDELGLDALRLAIAYDSTGASNLPALRGDRVTGAPVERGGASMRFDVTRLWLEDARLSLRDARDGRAVVVDGYDQELSLSGAVNESRLSTIALVGRIGIDSLAARMPGDSGWTVRGLRLGLEHDARFLADSGSVEADSVRLTVQQVTVAGSGSIDGVGRDGMPVLDVRFEAEEFDLTALLASLPESLVPLRESAPEVGGAASLAARVRGPVGLDTLPSVEGRLALRDVSVSREGDRLLEGLTGAVAFANDSLASGGLTGLLLGEPIRLSFSLREPLAPVIRFDVDGALVLERARAAGLLPGSLPPMQGRVALAARGTLVPSRPDTSAVTGTLDIRGFSVRPESASVTLSLPAGRMQLASDEVRARGLALQAGDQPVTLDVAVREWLPVALGDTAVVPRADVAVRAPRLDLAPLLGDKETPRPTYSQLLFARMSGAPIDGRDPAEIAAERGSRVPRLPSVRARVRLDIDTLVHAGVRYTDVDATLALTQEHIELERATFGVMGGRADVAATLTPLEQPGDSAPVGMLVRARGSVDGANAAPFLARFTTFRDNISGTLDLGGTAELALDRRMLPERDAVQASGAMTIREGRLVTWPVLRSLGERLGVAAFDTLRLDELAGGIEIVGPMVRLGEAVLASDYLDASVGGSFDLSGALDLGAELRVPASLAARTRLEPVRQLAAAASGESGSVPVGVRIGGTWRQPNATLDLSSARQNLADRARQEAEQQARRLAEQGAGKLADRLGLASDSTRADSVSAVDALREATADSASAVVDSARESVESGIRDRLRGLF